MNVNFEPIIRELKSDNLKCKIRFIFVGFNCKRKKKWGKKWMEISAIKGGVGGGFQRLMANAKLNFHFFNIPLNPRKVLCPRFV